jgi:hypothetical protein
MSGMGLLGACVCDGRKAHQRSQGSGANAILHLSSTHRISRFLLSANLTRTKRAVRACDRQAQPGYLFSFQKTFRRFNLLSDNSV